MLKGMMEGSQKCGILAQAVQGGGEGDVSLQKATSELGLWRDQEYRNPSSWVKESRGVPGRPRAQFPASWNTLPYTGWLDQAPFHSL